MKTVKVRHTKEDPIPDNLQLPANEALSAPKNRFLFWLRVRAAVPALFRQGGQNPRNRKIVWLTLTRDRGWKENLRRIGCHIREEFVKAIMSGPFLYWLGVRRADCVCTPGRGHRL